MPLKPNNILIATTNFNTGGLGSYLVTLAMGLKTCGWTVHLLVTNVRGDLFDRMKRSVECHDLSEQQLSRNKILKAAELVDSLSPDILLMNNCPLMHYALPLIKTRTKPIAVLHSDDKRFYKTAALFEKRIFRWIAPTQGVAERCMTYLSPALKERVRTIPHGINEKEFYRSTREDTKVRGNICFVGYIAENKGADLLPDIINRVSKEYPDARWTIVGYGPLEQTLKRRCEENGTLHKCIFTGAVEREKVAAILIESDILLLPTRIEGFGLSIVEAMMSGAVPVVSRIKGVTDDIVSDGITGMLIEPDDTEGFADAIVSLLKNSEKLILMSNAARETAVSMYSSETMIDAYETLFAEEDDRQKSKHKNKVGWLAELLPEVLRNNTCGDLLKKMKYLFR